MLTENPTYIYLHQENCGATSIVFATATQLVDIFGYGHRHHRTDEQVLETALKITKAVLYTDIDQVQKIIEEILDR